MEIHADAVAAGLCRSVSWSLLPITASSTLCVVGDFSGTNTTRDSFPDLAMAYKICVPEYRNRVSWEKMTESPGHPGVKTSRLLWGRSSFGSSAVIGSL